MEYYPTIPPVESDQGSLRDWAFQEFAKLAETLAENSSQLVLRGQAKLPAKFEEGTIINIIQAVTAESGQVLAPGLYIYRAGVGVWKPLVEA